MLTPTSSKSGVIYHAKPVLLQGAWLSVKHATSHDPTAGKATLAAFKKFQPQMKSLLNYWDAAPRKDPTTGLYVWHDQMQTGADNLVMSDCPDKSSKCWNESEDAWTLASVDLQIFMYREHTAYARFCTNWAAVLTVTVEESDALILEASKHTAKAAGILEVMEAYLWSQERGYYVGRNMSNGNSIDARTYLMAMPLWVGSGRKFEFVLRTDCLHMLITNDISA